MAADGTLRIRIGASADRSIDTVFGGIEKRALKTRDAINRSLGGAGAGGQNPLAKSMQGIERAAQKSADNADKIWNRELARLNAIARQQDRIYERVERNKVREAEKAARERVRVEERAARDIERAQREAQRRIDRDSAQAERTRRNFAERTSWRATKFLVPPPMGAIGVGRRIAGDMLRGAGIDFSLQGSVQRAVSLQQQAVQLANSAYIPGSGGIAAQRANPAELEKFVRQIAPQFGMTSGDTMEALRNYVGRTGDLATAKATLPGLLKLGAATGTDPQDLLTFAGTIGATMFDSPAANQAEAQARAQIINRTANVAAASGKLGTTEISDLAKYGPKLAATAQLFGGDAEKNLGEMYALAQLGLKGGAASAAQATTSVAAMANTLKTPARRKQFQAAGVELENKDGTFRSASDIITDSIVAAGTDTEKFKKMWANVQGARAVEGLRNIYLKAGGGEAGVSAVRGQFKMLGGGAMSQGEIDKSFGDVAQTMGFKAKSFQERWDDVIAKMSRDLLPSLEKLADPTIKLAGIFADTVKFASEMPLTFGGLVLAATVLRAGVESWARAALEKRIMGIPTGTPGIPGGGPGGSSVPAGMGGLFTGGGGFKGARGVVNSPVGGMIAAIAATAAVDKAMEQNDSLKQENAGLGIFDLMWGSITTGKGFSTQVDEKMNAEARARRAAEDAQAQVVKAGGGDGQGKNAPQLSAEDMQNVLAAANAKGIRITNLSELKGLIQMPGPTVSPAGRSPAPGQ